jgi:hypothetical protein
MTFLRHGKSIKESETQFLFPYILNFWASVLLELSDTGFKLRFYPQKYRFFIWALSRILSTCLGIPLPICTNVSSAVLFCRVTIKSIAGTISWFHTNLQISFLFRYTRFVVCETSSGSCFVPY